MKMPMQGPGPVRKRFLAAIISIAILCSGCAFGRLSSMQFRQDRRVRITSPKAHTTVPVPFVLRWTVKDFEVTGPTKAASRDAGYFAVFVDRAPVAPGRTLVDVARGDPHCTEARGCPDAKYLADHWVFTTERTSLTVDRLPEKNTTQRTEAHELTIVFLDGSGRRIGESAWRLQFNVRHIQS